MRWTPLLLAGCGRVGFAPIDDAALIAASDVGTPLGDVPSNAMTRSFGERPGLDFTGVTTDTFISNEAGEPDLNNGQADELRSEQDVSERILIRFALDAIPPSAQIIDAELTVSITQFDPSTVLSAYRVLEAWEEGTGDGSPGVANFVLRQGANAWSTAGAGMPGSAGDPLGSLSPTMLGDARMMLDLGIVQRWVTNPADNFGLVLFNSFTESTRIASSEASDASTRPMLIVTYLP